MQPVVPNVGGIGTQRQDIPEEPPRTPLGSSQETHPQEDTQPTVERVGSDEAGMANFIIAFPRDTHVTSTGTIPGTFQVKNEGFPINKVQLPGKF